MSGRRALATAAVAALIVVMTGAPAFAAPAPTPTPAVADVPDGLFLELTPSTVEAGYIVGIRASCTKADDEPPEDNDTATVESTAFDDVVVEPQFGHLTGAVTIPADTRARAYRVVLDCPGFLAGSAEATLNVLNDSQPSRGPATGFGGTAGDDNSTLVLTGGMTALAAGLVLAVVTLRRRRTA
ncbi:hypothetical protein Ais01nite_44630 [Asanoa ishikariensis]|uniref:Gram-positive cocci surface proteins LPxTG domain-containing protein n=1 Tax=Asanoa ishikariensis TaxID=137265 RepID=A0A1H3S8T0_9ACTN|nr:hypothetical protein [Asanoa ishikariensis]GIF66428.1 hypothetical protein Ais01nite_44630 [Asanoa ishikariensis]SDZ33539.1 hypothetical protein SAMN05421684_4620 [Asanoa ishikariensis]